jgi:Shikimate kinase
VLLIVAVAKPVVLVLMGVSGSGKSTVGGLLADHLGWPFEEGDTLHPQSNIEKMRAGIPSLMPTAGGYRPASRRDRNDHLARARPGCPLW